MCMTHGSATVGLVRNPMILGESRFSPEQAPRKPARSYQPKKDRDREYGKVLPSEGERHHRIHGNRGRSDDVLRHVVHHHRQPADPVADRHAVGRRVPGNHHRGHHRHARDGPVRQRSVRAGRRHGPERLLHLHRVLRTRLLLAADAVHGVPVRPNQHHHHRHQNP